MGEQFSETKVPLRFENQLDPRWPDQFYPDLPGVVLVQRNDSLDLAATRRGFPRVEMAYVTNARWIMRKDGSVRNTGRIGSDLNTAASSPRRPFFEPDERFKGKGLVPEVEFGRADDNPIFLPGFWRPWEGRRGTRDRPVEGEHELYTFLTTFSASPVKEVHKKAMPAIMEWSDVETWLNEPIEEAIKLQRPAPDGLLKILGSSAPQRKKANETSEKEQGDLF